MATTSPNLKLVLYDVTDGNVTFNDYWHSINLNADGTTYATSGFQLIDTEFGKTYTNIASIYSTSSVYAVGDFVIYEGILYKCISPVYHSNWDSNKWQNTSVTDYIKESLGDLDSILISINSGNGV